MDNFFLKFVMCIFSSDFSYFDLIYTMISINSTVLPVLSLAIILSYDCALRYF